MLNDVQTIEFNNKYVDGRAKDIITDFTRNTYIIKGSTGIGGTTALLNFTKGNCLIISPNLGMIKGKEGKQYLSNKQLFIYGKSKDTWNDAKDFLECDSNLIINTTPEQILKIKASNKELFSLLIQIPIFIDEMHSYSVDSSYRPALTDFMQLVYTEWLACFKLSTATPNYNGIDIPTDKQIDSYLIKRTNEPKRLLHYSERFKDANRFVIDESDKGRLVVVFSNDINVHKSFGNLVVKNLTGESLRIKLAPFERGAGDSEQELTENCDVLVLSSSYFAGFDIPNDCSICIISEQKCDAFKINVNNLVQAYGRCRGVVHNSLFINVKAKHNINGKPIEVPSSFVEVTNAFSHHNLTSDNYALNSSATAQLLVLANDYHLYNFDAFKGLICDYGFELSQYESGSDVIVQKTSTPFNKRILTLTELDSLTLKYHYFSIKNNLKVKDKGSYTTKLGLEYLTAYLLKISDAPTLTDKLNNKRVKPNEFYYSVDQMLRANTSTRFLSNQTISPKSKSLYSNDEVANNLTGVQYLINDWHMLYAIHKIDNNILPTSVEREITIYGAFYDVTIYDKFKHDKKNRVRSAQTHITAKLTAGNIELRTDELNWLNEVAKSIFKSLDECGKYSHGNSRKIMKSKMTNAIIYLMTNGKCNAEVNDVKGRIYSPLTQLPKAMRCILPLRFVSVDLTSANAQIVDNILGTSIALDVYKNLIQKRNITRQEAKVLYNSSLNNHYQSVAKANAIYLDAGYTYNDALRLAKMTANVEKGSFYELMTASEKTLMENYQQILPIQSYRFHDAIVMSYEDVAMHNLTLVNQLDKYVYHSEFFNDSDGYTGAVSDEPFSSSFGLLKNCLYLTGSINT